MKRLAKEKKKVIKEIEQEVVTHHSVVCNKCGKETKRDFDSEFFEDYGEGLWDGMYQSFGCSFGYGSKHDTERWQFDLCEECIVEYIKTFKHVPDGFYKHTSYYTIENEEEHQRIFDNWKETGKWEELKFKTYEQLVELSEIFNLDYINEVIKENYPNKPLIEEE